MDSLHYIHADVLNCVADNSWWNRPSRERVRTAVDAVLQERERLVKSVRELAERNRKMGEEIDELKESVRNWLKQAATYREENADLAGDLGEARELVRKLTEVLGR